MTVSVANTSIVARGAAWRRWEPHIHSPGTAMSDNFGSTTLDEYLDALEAADDPAIEALGVTDYLLTRRYEEVLASKAGGRLPRVALVFCNIEIRLGMETKAGKGVNMHMLVSPDDPKHVEEINRFLSKLTFSSRFRVASPQHRDFVAQDEQLSVLRRRRPGQQGQPAAEPRPRPAQPHRHGP